MTAKFVLSLDTELAWGTFYWRGFEYYKRHFDAYRPLLHRFIRLLDGHGISATWAVVGHLFLESCDGVHADVLRPRYSWFKGEDWHKFDPGTDAGTDPYWYAPDIVAAIRDMKTPQEIATHTFSHAFLDDPECTPDIAESQVEACIRIGRERGLDIESLVFPRDGVGHLPVYAPLGITSYRGVERVWYRNTRGMTKRVCGLIDHALALTPPVYRPAELEHHHGLVNIPGSTFVLAYDRYHRLLPRKLRVAKVRKGIDRAIRDDAIFHLAFHPFHLGSSEKMFKVFEDIFFHVSEQRAKGRLEVATMRDVQRQYLARFAAARPMAAE